MLSLTSSTLHSQTIHVYLPSHRSRTTSIPSSLSFFPLIHPSIRPFPCNPDVIALYLSLWAVSKLPAHCTITPAQLCMLVTGSRSFCLILNQRMLFCKSIVHFLPKSAQMSPECVQLHFWLYYSLNPFNYSEFGSYTYKSSHWLLNLHIKICQTLPILYQPTA